MLLRAQWLPKVTEYFTRKSIQSLRWTYFNSSQISKWQLSLKDVKTKHIQGYSLSYVISGITSWKIVSITFWSEKI